MDVFSNIFDSAQWAAVPFHFWSAVLFALGCICGSFFNVCIYRMPLDQSVISPPSHCPHCKYSIPFYMNIPLVTWLWLRGQCANCRAPISPRYFAVELLTGLLFLACWLVYGHQSALVALVMCVLVSGLIVATFIDFEHFIIPDEITLGGIGAGFLLSFLVPALHETIHPAAAMKASFLGAAAGGAVVYAILRIGKLLFGRQKVALPPESRVIFGEESIQFADQQMAYADIFYRRGDTIRFQAKRLELMDRCYADAEVRLTQDKLRIDEDEFDPETVKQMEAVTDQMILPREAMGFGDVKFVAAIGAFLGWPGALFSLFASSILGAVAGITLLAMKRHEWSARIPYGPYIAAAALIWILGAEKFVGRFLAGE
jgi:leader peptidase (prepilin peptidase)/N-methyltransferase